MFFVSRKTSEEMINGVVGRFEGRINHIESELNRIDSELRILKVSQDKIIWLILLVLGLNNPISSSLLNRQTATIIPTPELPKPQVVVPGK
jgi:hypothetical protein